MWLENYSSKNLRTKILKWTSVFPCPLFPHLCNDEWVVIQHAHFYNLDIANKQDGGVLKQALQ